MAKYFLHVLQSHTNLHLEVDDLKKRLKYDKFQVNGHNTIVGMNFQNEATDILHRPSSASHRRPTTSLRRRRRHDAVRRRPSHITAFDKNQFFVDMTQEEVNKNQIEQYLRRYVSSLGAIQNSFTIHYITIALFIVLVGQRG